MAALTLNSIRLYTRRCNWGSRGASRFRFLVDTAYRTV